jgi:hypothetical protein
MMAEDDDGTTIPDDEYVGRTWTCRPEMHGLPPCKMSCVLREQPSDPDGTARCPKCNDPLRYHLADE